MKILRTTLFTACIVCWAVDAGAEGTTVAGGWETNFSVAKEKAKNESRDLVLNFTGSDWCGFCIALRDQVLSKPLFEKAAAEHFILVELDYPRHKEQSEDLREQNEALRGHFAVKGFPTLILADAHGRAFAQISNQPGIEPDHLVAQMRSLQGLREKRDELMAAAETLEGLKRAEKLDEALDVLDDELVERFYGESIDEIISLDDKDTLKRKKDRKFAKGLLELEQRVQELAKQQDHNRISAAVDAFVEKKKLKGENLQRTLMLKLGLFGGDKLEEAAEFLKKVEKEKPDSSIGRDAASIRTRIQQYTSDK